MLLSVKNISKEYNNGITALKNVSFDVEKGEFISIIGPSGSGKSTLLRSINKMIDISQGSILFENRNIEKLKKKEIELVRREIGMIFQNYNLVERLTVFENALHGCLGAMPLYRSLFGLYSKQEKERALNILNELGLSEYIYRRCADLSGGQKQRVGIARALMQEPEILLCDEPVSSLDPQSAQDILNYIEKTVRARNLTCIMNLHHVGYAQHYSDRILALRNGRLVFDGKPSELSEKTLDMIFSSGIHSEKEARS